MNSQQFEQRKQEHMQISLSSSVQATGLSELHRIRLQHEALPDLDLAQVQTRAEMLGNQFSLPIFISSMTAGHKAGESINQKLAKFAQDRNILMGVGSQRKELAQPEASLEWKTLRKVAPQAKLVGNIGISQLQEANVSQIQKLVDDLQAVGLFVHLNPLQECLQPEGTPFFRGALARLENLIRELSVPVVVKEVGCGMSESTLQRLYSVGVSCVDVSGAGGTHWGRIEGARAQAGDSRQLAAATFADWGVSTVQSLLSAKQVFRGRQVWASGGIRSGLDVAKMLAMGASAVGVAMPFMAAVTESEQKLHSLLDQYEFELRVAMFCTGVGTINEFQTKKVWAWT